MWAIFIISGLFVLLIALLIMPLEFEINTEQDIYEVRAGKIMRAGVIITDDGSIKIKLVMVWKIKYIQLFPYQPNIKKTPKKAANKNKKQGKPRVKDIFKRIISVIKSFKVKKCEVNIDTDDYILNAYLYPLVFMLKRKTGHNVQINFSGITEADVLVNNTLLRMGWAFINYNR